MPFTHVAYLGLLSRMPPAVPGNKPRAGLLISLSGPEPQRTMLEKMVLKALPQLQEKVWLVRGLPLAAEVLTGLPPNTEVYNHLPAMQLQQLMLQCRLMLCRSGYSTLMDALITQTPVATIPTPGQTEQEYLAAYLFEKKWAPYMPQRLLNIPDLVNAAATFSWPPLQPSAIFNTTVIDQWLGSLKQQL
jgi:UDP:flavonoid glycosyltransferase YjiC (YdhE family)